MSPKPGPPEPGPQENLNCNFLFNHRPFNGLRGGEVYADHQAVFWFGFVCLIDVRKSIQPRWGKVEEEEKRIDVVLTKTM